MGDHLSEAPPTKRQKFNNDGYPSGLEPGVSDMPMSSFDLESSLPDELMGGGLTGAVDVGARMSSVAPSALYGSGVPVNGAAPDAHIQMMVNKQLGGMPNKNSHGQQLQQSPNPGVQNQLQDEQLLNSVGPPASSSSLLLSNALAASPMKSAAGLWSGGPQQLNGPGGVSVNSQQLATRTVPSVRGPGPQQQQQLMMQRQMLQQQPATHMQVRGTLTAMSAQQMQQQQFGFPGQQRLMLPVSVNNGGGSVVAGGGAMFATGGAGGPSGVVQRFMGPGVAAAQSPVGKPSVAAVGIRPPPPSTGDPEKRKLIQQQLVLLLHAHKCQRREQTGGEQPECRLPHCQTMKEVLNHMTSCQEGKACRMPHCASSRQIITHWKSCRRTDCPVCLPLKQAENRRGQQQQQPAAATQQQPQARLVNSVGQQSPVSSGAAGFPVLVQQQQPGGHLANQLKRPLMQQMNVTVSTAGGGSAAPQQQSTPPAAGGIPQQLQQQPAAGGPVSNQQQLANINSYLVNRTEQLPNWASDTSHEANNTATGNANFRAMLDPVQANPVHDTKEWHMQVTPDLRTHLVRKLVQAIFPVPDPSAMHDRRMHNLVDYAKKVEGDMYAMANSRSEYYHLLAEKIYKIQKDLEEKRQLRQAAGGGVVPTAGVPAVRLGLSPGGGVVNSQQQQQTVMRPAGPGAVLLAQQQPPSAQQQLSGLPSYSSLTSSGAARFPGPQQQQTMEQRLSVSAAGPVYVQQPPQKQFNNGVPEVVQSTPVTVQQQAGPLPDQLFSPAAWTPGGLLDVGNQQSDAPSQGEQQAAPTSVQSATADQQSNDTAAASNNLNQQPAIKVEQNNSAFDNLLRSGDSSSSSMAGSSQQQQRQPSGPPSAAAAVKPEPESVGAQLPPEPSPAGASVAPLEPVGGIKSEPGIVDKPSWTDGVGSKAAMVSVKEEPRTPKVEPSAETSADSKQLVAANSVDKKSRKPLFSADELRHALMPTLEKLYRQEPESIPFRQPVDPNALGIPDYFEIVRQPMDLATIKRKLDTGQFDDPWQYVEDVWLMFDNAWIYNRKTSKVYKFCSKLSEIFEQEIDPVMQQLGYCCGRKFTFQPQTLCCYGHSGLCSIPRDAKYYSYQNRITYCLKCFNEIPGDVVSEDATQPPMSIKKDAFVEMKNDKFEREAMVVCSDCGRRLHQICVLHMDVIWPQGFTCDNCLKAKSMKRKENKFTARRLPHTKLGTYIENRVNNYLKKKESCSGEVFIRVVSSGDKICEVKGGMKTRFCDAGDMPYKFPYRAKALFAFEDIDGHEVCFFGMHVQEYGSECAQPNRRRVYIAYLDSVHFFRPRQFRTAVYHEILLAYLDYAKQLGYTMAHIWACPPCEGDDYIFHCHPTDQKIPKPKRLQEWYKKMLDKGIIDRIVMDYKDILKQAHEDGVVSPAELAYFEGDFWPGILEESIRELDQEEEEKRKQMEEEEARAAAAEPELEGITPDGKKKGAQKKQNKKNTKSKTNSKSKSKKSSQSGSDLSAKIFAMMEKHKEVFFVVRLHSAQSAASLQPIQDPDTHISCELMDGRDNFLSMAREKHLEFSSLRRALAATQHMLYELHNQNQESVVYTCNSCKSNIDTRYHCTICEDFDLCVACYGKERHPHKMEKLGFDLDDGSPGEQRGQPSSEVRRQSLERCIKSLVHSCQCRDANCRLQSCQKMKRVVSHTKSCRKKVNGGCPICKQLVAVCCYHAKCCKEDKCMVPFCNSIKSRLAHQQMQAQLQSKALLQRRMAQMRSVCAASASAAPAPAASLPTAGEPSGSHGGLHVEQHTTTSGGSMLVGGKPGGQMSTLQHPHQQQHPQQQPSPNVLMAVKQVQEAAARQQAPQQLQQQQPVAAGAMGYGKNNPPLQPAGMVAMPSPQMRPRLQMTMAQQPGRVLPSMNEWGNRYPGGGGCMSGQAGGSGPAVLRQPMTAGGAGGGQMMRAAVGMAAAAPGQQQPPRSNIPGLQELLLSLKNPTGPHAQEDVLQILKSHPQLMAQVIRMQQQKQMQQQQQQQQQQQHQMLQQPAGLQQVQTRLGAGTLVNTAARMQQVPISQQQQQQQQWAVKQQQFMAIQRQQQQQQQQHSFQQPQAPPAFQQQPGFQQPQRVRQPHAMAMQPQRFSADPTAAGAQFPGQFTQQQQLMLQQQRPQTASPHLQQQQQVMMAPPTPQQLLHAVRSPPPGLPSAVRSPQPIASPRHVPSPHRPASHSPHPAQPQQTLPAAGGPADPLANEMMLSLQVPQPPPHQPPGVDNADKLSKFADTL